MYIDVPMNNNIPLLKCTAADPNQTIEHPMNWLTIAEAHQHSNKPYIEFHLAEKTSETKESIWDLGIRSDFVRVFLSSHEAMPIKRAWAHKYENYQNIHSMKMRIKDYHNKVTDEWNVVYLSICRGVPRSFTNPAPRSFQKTVLVRFIRHCDDTQTKWHW